MAVPASDFHLNLDRARGVVPSNILSQGILPFL